MSKHCIIQLTTVDNTQLSIDTSRIEAVLTGAKVGQTVVIVSSSDTYTVMGSVYDIAEAWKEAL